MGPGEASLSAPEKGLRQNQTNFMRLLPSWFRFPAYAAMALLWLLSATGSRAQKDNNLMYEIFVRSFADTAGDTAASGGETGDLKGLREKLDYLNDGKPETDDDLEAGILWLMPIFPCTSYHGYDITD